MRILITGATGFIGKTLIPYLCHNGYCDLGILIRNEAKAKDLFSNLPIKIISTENESWGAEIIEFNADTVLHMATFFTSKRDKDNAIKIIDTNILFTTLLLEAVSHTDCRAFINIGTFREFANIAGELLPQNLYSASKAAVRTIIKYYQTQSNWKYINIIIYSAYGRKNNNKLVIDYLIQASNSPTPTNFTKGEQVLDFIHVDDIADFFCTLFSKLGQIKQDYVELHLGTGKGHSIREVSEIIETVFKKKVNANWGGIEYSPLEMMQAIAPIEKNKIIDWEPKINIETGIKILKNDLEN